MEDSGWHFTNIGGLDFIKEKLDAYSAQEFNTSANRALLAERIAANQDYLGRGFTFTEDYSLPQYILDNKQKYAHLFKSF